MEPDYTMTRTTPIGNQIVPFISHSGFHVMQPDRIRSVTQNQLHSQSLLELLFVADGEYHLRILDQEIVIRSGEFCFIDKHCLRQELAAGRPATILDLGISDVCLNELLRHTVLPKRIRSFIHMSLLESKTLQQYLHFTPVSKEIPQIEAALQLLQQELELHDDASPLICQGLILRIFQCLGTQYNISLENNAKRPDSHALFEEIAEYMNTHLKNISILHLSQSFHFQEDYFNRLFKSQTGLTYTEYLQLLRLRRAEQLLLTTDYNIDRIAAEVGYHNKGYFYKIFTRKYNMTPAQYRRKKETVN